MIGRRELARDVFELSFRSTSPAPFAPGRFVTVQIPASGEKPLTMRSYTFASASPDPLQFELCIKIFRYPDGSAGQGSGYLTQLALGDEISFLAPAAGEWPLPDDSIQQILLLGTGTGVAPVKALAELLTQKKSTQKMQLYLGVSYAEDLFYESEFAELAAANPNFSYTLAISRPAPDYTGRQGRLPAVLAEDFLQLDSATVAFVCGSSASASGIADQLLALGLPQDHLFVKGFGD